MFPSNFAVIAQEIGELLKAAGQFPTEEDIEARRAAVWRKLKSVCKDGAP